MQSRQQQQLMLREHSARGSPGAGPAAGLPARTPPKGAGSFVWNMSWQPNMPEVFGNLQAGHTEAQLRFAPPPPNARPAVG